MKNKVTLIDTSSWIEALRTSGNKSIREKVLNLMVNGKAAWCEMVALELWNGARGIYEKQKMAELEKEITCLQITTDVWETAKKLAQKCRQNGQTVPTSDLVISACALYHNVEIEHCDSHIQLIIDINSKG